MTVIELFALQQSQTQPQKNDDLPWNDLGFHGGDLYWAAERFGRPVDQWIDLSTGVNPNSYPIPDVKAADYQRLPYLSPEFLASIEGYYGQPGIPVSGSQQAIDLLPGMLKKLPVLLPEVGYKGYEKIFRQADFYCQHYPSLDKASAMIAIMDAITLNPNQHVVIINPNNPTGLIFTPEELLEFAKLLAPDAMLIVDEAFMDVTPEGSMLNDRLLLNVLVFRSFGKFFGLAGLRLGVVFTSNTALINRLDSTLDPWRINGLAQAVATKAYSDNTWQSAAREQLATQKTKHQAKLLTLVNQTQGRLLVRQGLFSAIIMPASMAQHAWQALALKGILTRQVPVSSEKTILRIGIGGDF
ncbi:MAG: aminotransferase class I/II-fold pyridoxal phosphate-dependent enzyme [Cellvibrionales bacterium]|nr:aminotransferase class I/II-fold pyridoxal phosphate-dependent enzyme [Cellvibrionales bacterium]